MKSNEQKYVNEAEVFHDWWMRMAEMHPDLPVGTMPDGSFDEGVQRMGLRFVQMADEMEKTNELNAIMERLDARISSLESSLEEITKRLYPQG